MHLDPVVGDAHVPVACTLWVDGITVFLALRIILTCDLPKLFRIQEVFIALNRQEDREVVPLMELNIVHDLNLCFCAIPRRIVKR